MRISATLSISYLATNGNCLCERKRSNFDSGRIVLMLASRWAGTVSVKCNFTVEYERQTTPTYSRSFLEAFAHTQTHKTSVSAIFDTDSISKLHSGTDIWRRFHTVFFSMVSLLLSLMLAETLKIRWPHETGKPFGSVDVTFIMLQVIRTNTNRWKLIDTGPYTNPSPTHRRYGAHRFPSARK